MALQNCRRRPILGPWGDAALELLKRRGLDGFDASGDHSSSEPQYDAATRVHVMASAVWELHEARSPISIRLAEPRLRSLKGQSPETEPRLIELGLERLRALPAKNWSRCVRLHHYDYRGAAVARAFLREARRALPADPAESASWARLVHQAAGVDRLHYCAHDPEQIALHLRASLYEANAERCDSHLDRADVGFRHLQDEAIRLAVSDPEFWSELASFQASLLRARREFCRALHQAELAAAICAQGHDTAGEVRARWQIASIYEVLGQPREALLTIRLARQTASELTDSPLLFGLAHAEVSYLARSGAFQEAHVAYRVLEPEYLLYPDSEPFRLWVAGLIDHGLGRLREAEDAFRAARNAFLTAENPYDAALVTIDWTLFLLDQNRAEEVLPLAVSMGQAFEALGVARETLASWAIFQAAAERRELTRAVAESMVRTLGEERAGAKPGQ